jgi:AcrR family transcriptional regulator
MSPERKTTRPRARRRDADVLAAATKVFYDRGYEGASVQDVADELGILKGSLYHYIRTKEDLLFRLFEDVHEQVDEILDDLEAEDIEDPLTRLSEYIRRQVDYNLANLERIAIYYHDMGSLTGARLEEVAKARRRHDRFVTRCIRDAQERGLSDPEVDPRVVSPCIFASIIWTYRWYKPNGRLSRARVAESVADFALRGVARSESTVASG